MVEPGGQMYEKHYPVAAAYSATVLLSCWYRAQCHRDRLFRTVTSSSHFVRSGGSRARSSSYFEHSGSTTEQPYRALWCLWRCRCRCRCRCRYRCRCRRCRCCRCRCRCRCRCCCCCCCSWAAPGHPGRLLAAPGQLLAAAGRSWAAPNGSWAAPGCSLAAPGLLLGCSRP